MQKILLVRAFDVYLGAWLARAEPVNERAKLYGKPGAMRFKSYGLEWRTLSNYWLSSPKMMEVVFNTCWKITEMVKQKNSNQVWKQWP